VEVAKLKKVMAMHANASHKWAIVHPDQLNFRDFSSQKPNFEFAAMHSVSSEGDMLRFSYDLELWPACSAS